MKGLFDKKGVPIDPPADMEQNSNTPSNAGLSSPTKTTYWSADYKQTPKAKERTSSTMVGHLLRRLGRDVVQKVDVFVGVEGAHNLGRRPLGAL